MGSVIFVPRIPPLGQGAFTWDTGGLVYRRADAIFVVTDLTQSGSRRYCSSEREARLLASRRWPTDRWVTSSMTTHMIEHHRIMGEMTAERREKERCE